MKQKLKLSVDNGDIVVQEVVEKVFILTSEVKGLNIVNVYDDHSGYVRVIK